MGSHQLNYAVCFLLPLSCFMFHVSYFMLQVSYVLVTDFHNFVTSSLLRLSHLIQIYQNKQKFKTHVKQTISHLHVSCSLLLIPVPVQESSYKYAKKCIVGAN